MMGNPGPNVQQSTNTVAGYSAINTSTYSPVIALQSNVPIGQAPSGTVTGAGTGNLVLGTALDLIYGPTSNNIPGIWLYFPSTALSGLAAGFYWCVMTSTTVGTVYTNTYSGIGAPGIPASTTVATGSGNAYTQPTGAYASVIACAIAGNTIGPNGSAVGTFSFSNNNSAGNKQVNLYWNTAAAAGGIALVNASNSTNVTLRSSAQVQNMGVTNAQTRVSTTYGASGTAIGSAAYDTTQTTYMLIAANIATATDWLIVQAFNVTVSYS